MTEIGKERGWPRMTRGSFDAQRNSQGALLVGDPEEVVRRSLGIVIVLQVVFPGSDFYDEPSLITSCKRSHASDEKSKIRGVAPCTS